MNCFEERLFNSPKRKKKRGFFSLSVPHSTNYELFERKKKIIKMDSHNVIHIWILIFLSSFTSVQKIIPAWNFKQVWSNKEPWYVINWVACAFGCFLKTTFENAENPMLTFLDQWPTPTQLKVYGYLTI